MWTIRQSAFPSVARVCVLLVFFLGKVSAQNVYFTQPSYNASIPEDAVAKSYAIPEEKMGIYLPSSDFDVRYKIKSGDGNKIFKAESQQVGDFSFLHIRMRTGNSIHLNRERKDSYVLEVLAKVKMLGKGRGEIEAKTIVNIRVLDVNDFFPLFYPTKYEIQVPEDMPLHQSIKQVSAQDPDLGVNGEIYYSLLETTDQFAIHPTTGVLTLTRPLVYAERSYHQLTIIARDRGQQTLLGISKGTPAKLIVNVTQVNLHDPKMNIHHLPEIIEHSNADVYAIGSVIDEDKGIHGELKTVEIIEGSPDGHFRTRPGTQPNEFFIEVLRFLDREKSPYGYNLTLRATDKGTPPRSTLKTVTVKLMDTNDNAPVFDKEEYVVRVSEFAPVETPVVRVRASDTDFGKNAEVVFSIVGGNEGGEFSIHPKTGLITSKRPLDAETKPFHTLTISALDQGNAGTRKQSAAKVKVEVKDENDNNPVFDKSEEEVQIRENEAEGIFVARVHAQDQDTGDNGYVSYSISNLNKVPFKINYFTGVITTTETLDFETMRRVWILKIRASDWGSPYRRQSETTLKVRVRDINDNRPQFEKVNCRGYVSRQAPIGTEILTLSAIDFDEGNIITYRLASGNEDSCFELDGSSGVLRVHCDLADLVSDERMLNVTATDGQHFADVMPVRISLVNNKRSSQLHSDDVMFECSDTGVTQRMRDVITLSDRNNLQLQEDFALMPSRFGGNIHTPTFLESLPESITVNESLPLGAEILEFKAKDRDLGYNGKIVYSITSGDEDAVFEIGMETGVIRVVGHLDRERTPKYTLEISCYDLGSPEKSSTRSLTIDILDVNDNSPEFQKSLYSVTVSESTPIGTSVLRLLATDIDEGVNGEVTYQLVTDTKHFSVDSASGVLVVSGPLDREVRDLHTLRVRAVDRATNPRSSTVTVRVQVQDYNDNPPKFPLNFYSLKIREDLPVGTVVVILTAHDPDLEENGRVEYSLSPTALDRFSIDRQMGTVRIARELDFETKNIYNVTVVARDRGTPALRSETYVLIEVVNVNENTHPPLFPSFVTNGSVPENSPIGTEVLQVKATDLDPPQTPDGQITYSIRGGDGLGYFSVDDQGMIRTLRVLDRETNHRHWLTVYAQDKGLVPLSSKIEVYIEVLDVNDNVPHTKDPIYLVSILENSPEDTEVLKLEAYDHDATWQRLTFSIISGNPQTFFKIDPTTGESARISSAAP